MASSNLSTPIPVISEVVKGFENDEPTKDCAATVSYTHLRAHETLRYVG